MENQPTQTPITNPVTPPIIPVVENKYSKYLNKKTLKIVGIVFGVFLVLVILLSVITKNIKNIVTPTNNSPTPTPEENIINPQNQSTVSGELAPNQIKLIDLKKQISELDIEQNRLKPPAINFKINFEAKK